jgi:hypothetical protein
MAPAKTPRAISSFFNVPSSTTAAPALASPVDAPAPLPALPSSALPVVIETVGFDDGAWSTFGVQVGIALGAGCVLEARRIRSRAAAGFK